MPGTEPHIHNSTIDFLVFTKDAREEGITEVTINFTSAYKLCVHLCQIIGFGTHRIFHT